MELTIWLSGDAAERKLKVPGFAVTTHSRRRRSSSRGRFHRSVIELLFEHRSRSGGAGVTRSETAHCPLGRTYAPASGGLPFPCRRQVGDGIGSRCWRVDPRAPAHLDKPRSFKDADIARPVRAHQDTPNARRIVNARSAERHLGALVVGCAPGRGFSSAAPTTGSLSPDSRSCGPPPPGRSGLALLQR